VNRGRSGVHNWVSGLDVGLMKSRGSNYGDDDGVDSDKEVWRSETQEEEVP
jgi:hypothetical protein